VEVNGQLHASASSPPEKEPELTLDTKLGRPRGGLEAVGKTKFSLPFARIEPTSLSRADHNLVVIPTKQLSG
jgi:hypothetical protein